MSAKEERSSEELLIHTKRSEEDDSEWNWSNERHRTKSERSLSSWILLLNPWLLIILLGSINVIQFQRNKTSSHVDPSQQIYSPVQDLLEYELRVFHSGHEDDMSPYVGEPSPELDKVWTDLYPSLFQLIPKEQAVQLVNQTVIFPHDPERRYVIELDVFHQLHCLNMIRQSLRPDYYQPSIPHIINGKEEDGLYGPHHMQHCIEIIRQAIMCASDVTPYTWEWDEELKSLRNSISTPHTCRNFEKIREWAEVGNYGGDFEGGFDFDFRELNDPLKPETWVDGYAGE